MEDDDIEYILLSAGKKERENEYDGHEEDEPENFFAEVTTRVLDGEDDLTRGYTSYDLISRTLHQLARDGNHELLALALDRLGDQAQRRINQLDDDHLAPLHYAARYAHPYTVTTLLQRNAKVNIQGLDDLTPLHFAARYRRSINSAEKRRQKRLHLSRDNVAAEDKETEEEEKEEETEEEEKEEEETEEEEKEEEMEAENYSGESRRMSSLLKNIDGSRASVIKILVDNGADIEARDIYGLSPLHYAAMRGNDVAARDLLSFSHIDIEARDKQLMTPLFLASTYGYVDICRMLISSGADVIATDESKQTTLHKAAAEGHLEIVELILAAVLKSGGEERVNKLLSIRDGEKQTALHVAVSNGNLQTSRLLLLRGADVNSVRDTLATPLHAAAVVGHQELISLLLEYGANVDAVDSNQQTPLHKAALNNQSEAIKILLQHKAKIEKRDKDSFTPLLLAASAGHSAAIQILIDLGACVEAVDKDDKTAVFWCAQQGQKDALKVLLSSPECATLVDLSDRIDNSPLHEAARQGYIDVVKVLLDAGSKIDNKNEDEETALHLAAEEGQTEVVKELISRFRFMINDENEDANTPLHLASLNGKEEVVQLLLEASADVEARNTALWTPLDCAAANGHVETCRKLIEYDSPLDPLDKTKTTPLQLAAQRGHVPVVTHLLEEGADISAVDASSRNALELAISAGQRDVALAIVKSKMWLQALRNVRTVRGCRITPFRLLIQKFPDVAKVVLDRCITTNGHDPDQLNYGIKFNFELVDDTYVISKTGRKDSISTLSLSSVHSPFKEDGKLLENAVSYTNDTRILKRNHPLSLMVRFRRTGLLGHPVCVSLLKHKWKSYARYAYYFNLIFYIVFLSFLTGYVVTSVDWRYAEFLLNNKNSSNSSMAATVANCSTVAKELGLEPSDFAIVAKWVIIVMAALNIAREVFQLIQARLNYIGVENFLEWVCYIGALLLVIDWGPDTKCFIRQDWQWQVGSVAIFLAWINLVLFVRRLPLFGIYVVMFTDIFLTFTRFFVVFFLFIIGFALSFFMIFRNQLPFDHVGKSLLKTSVMMIGEFEYDSIFSMEGDGLPYPVVSYIMFVAFLMLMSILIMNLLIGLAVDDIKAVQDQAMLKRRAMQTQLIMDVEVLIPETLRRYFASPWMKFFPNKRRMAVSKIFSDFNLLHSFVYDGIPDQQSELEELQRTVSTLSSQLNDLKVQNQKILNLFASTAAFSKKHKCDATRVLSADN